MVSLRTAFPWGNGHVHTIFPVLLRPQPVVKYERSRLEISDGDFVDLDWSCAGHKRLVLIVHGLEGNSRRKYVLGMAVQAHKHGFDVLAMNLRGCSGEPNRKLAMYHSGWTLDLHEILVMLHKQYSYLSVDLIGFSLGGNIILKYLGESASLIPPLVRRAMVFSVPCDLEDAARALARPQCRIYNWYLLSQLRQKVMHKHRLFPGLVDVNGLQQIRSFQDFDDRYTAPWHGFRNALDYWHQSSCKQFLPKIMHPTCVVNALDDPFLGPQCYPFAEARNNKNLCLLVPPTGGHVGFLGTKNQYWSEWLAMQFLTHAVEEDVQSFSFSMGVQSFCA